eukprot:Gregarina_sp_Poly_1__9968@NODE_65_length_16489_cov_69_850445_g56_i0_p3_GENE_NODE_65_length_16489_cov_69_850445_g56_i0NODE_65_length_16489_cov_69_850445_g56_i0_p3_ORF_typecomplete_len552_score76_27Trehalase/PF01204_18/4_7e72GDE_C/PF06202_14/4_8e18Bac_rhamnosid6H/PF17389_2/5_1e03Bac_rhamnosid6H/PF17389_2/2e08Glyco_hydro_36/PF17167_4/0_011DUF608/PF04685_13/0_26_NODE_65_length_16489_cov_69_850445_g56_i0963411289
MRLRGFTTLVFLWAPSQGGLSLTSTQFSTRSLQSKEPANVDRLNFYESELFRDVQLSLLFQDSKTFPDMTPREELGTIIAEYESRKHTPSFSLDAFVEEFFDMPDVIAVDDGKAKNGEGLKEYIERMWPLLTRSFTQGNGSLLPLPKQSIVPGGRFREAYYWDSLFPFLVLLEDTKRRHLALDILDNLAYLVREYGYIPNANRDYYIGRSQPPVMAIMINSLFEQDPDHAVKYLDALQTEFNFWTSPDALDSKHDPTGRTVTGSDGIEVHIYDAGFGHLPRPEAWKEDVDSMKGHKPHNEHQLYRDIRASCESGWDFTSRFSIECNPTACLRTTEFAPIELNVFIQHGARVLARLYAHEKDQAKATQYNAIADDKRQQINHYFWNSESGCFADRFWRSGKFSQVITPAAIMPLAFNLTTPEKASSTIKVVTEALLKKGGLATTKQTTGQQWDFPFGWAPLQYFYIVAALNYGFLPEATEVASRWLRTVESNFHTYGRIFEKYNVETGQFTVKGGEYVTQAGFAFTNAVTYDLIQMIEYLKANKAYKPLLTP